MPEVELFNRELALDKALQLFWEKGFNGIPVPELSVKRVPFFPVLHAAFLFKKQFIAMLLFHCIFLQVVILDCF